jgi:polysaccharide pyruvyl transferase WcaK-like protein
MTISPIQNGQRDATMPVTIFPNRPRKILLCGSSSICGFHNFGDELLRDLYHHWLTALLPDADIVMLKFRGLFGSHADWTSQFDQADALVYIGGGYFGEADHPGMNIFHRHLRTVYWALRNHKLYGGAFRVAQQQRIPHAVAGVEVGPIHTGFYRKCVVKLLETADVCTLRTPESACYAEQYGVRRRDVRVCVDAVLSLAPETLPADAINERDKLLAHGSSFRLGLHLNSLGNAHWNARGRIVDLIQNLSHQLKKGTPISLYFIHDQAKNGEPPKSRVAAEHFFRSQFPNMIVLPYKGHWPLVGVLGGMNAVITTKLHVGITARALSVPVLSIPRHQKTPRFYRLIGEDWCCVPIDRLSGEAIPSPLQNMLTNWKPGQLLPVSRTARQSAQQNQAVLAEFVSRFSSTKRLNVA